MIINSNLEVIGNEYKRVSTDYITLNTGVDTILSTLVLPAGTYLIYGNVQMNVTGNHYIKISGKSMLARKQNTGNMMYDNMVCFATFTEETTVLLSAYQVSGSNVNAVPNIFCAVRLK